MRAHGLVADADGLGLHGHACWLYDDEAELRRVAARHLAEGVRLGQRLLYVGDGTPQQLRESLALLGDAAELEAAGRLQVAALDSVCDVEAFADVDARLGTYAAATEGAIAAGYSGLRVLAETTRLVIDPEGWHAHAAWERAADAFMVREPMSALCCYDRRVLPEAIMRTLSCVHPAGNTDGDFTPFRLYAGRDGLMLEGEVDCFSADALRLALADAPADVEVDLSAIRFMDHHAVIALSDAGVRLRSVPPLVQRICGIVGVSL